MGNIKPTQEQIIRWSEEFQTDQVLATFYDTMTRIVEAATLCFIVSEKDGKTVVPPKYDDATEKRLKTVESHKNDYINIRYKHLINEGFLNH